MSRYVRQNVTSVHSINRELSKIEEAIQDTLSRLGDTPNEMEANLDMNSNRVYNLPEPVNDSEAVRLQDLREALESITDLVCVQISGDMGSVSETPGLFVDFGSIANPALCFQDYGFLPAVLTPVTKIFETTIGDVSPSGIVSLDFEYPLDIDALDVILNGSDILAFEEIDNTTIMIDSDAVAASAADSIVRVKYRYTQLN